LVWAWFFQFGVGRGRWVGAASMALSLSGHLLGEQSKTLKQACTALSVRKPN
jgi:hypothetical protein